MQKFRLGEPAAAGDIRKQRFDRKPVEDRKPEAGKPPHGPWRIGEKPVQPRCCRRHGHTLAPPGGFVPLPD